MEDGIETTRTTAVEGVRVRKTIAAGADGTAVVTLEVDLEREEPTTVRITEPALGAVARDEIELHTDHGAEYWHVGETATFEREFDAGESYEVVYRVTGVDEERFDALDAVPVVDPVDAAIDDLVDRDDSDAVRELIAGERESLAAAPAAGGVELSLDADASDPAGEPAVDAESDPVDVDANSGPVDVDSESGPLDEDADDPAPEPASASSGGPAEDPAPEEIPVDDSPEEISVGVPADDEPSDPDGTPAGPDSEAEDTAGESEPEAEPEEPEEPAAAADSTPSDEPPAADLEASLAATPSGGLARVLLKELREGHVDEATREALREELGAELEAGPSQDVRIKHLQSQVAEFSAYVELLDGFVDEHGTFESVFGEVSSLDEEVESVRSELDGVADAVEDVDEATAAVEDLQDGQDALRDGQDDLAARVDRLEEELATIDDRLDEFDEFKDRLSGAFQGVGNDQ